jgi:hypothetical protein
MTSAAKLWQRLTSASQSTRRYLPASSQTKRSWARVADSLSSIPVYYQDQIEVIAAAHGCFPYSIVTPTYEGFLAKESEKVICAFSDKLYVLSNHSGIIDTQTVVYSAITYIQHASVLLKSWLKWTVVEPGSSPEEFVIRYNSASERCFRPLLKLMRSNWRGQPSPAVHIGTQCLQYIEQLDYKMYNYAVSSLLPGQQLHSCLYQSAVQQDLIRLPRAILSRTISPAHLAIMTDDELILISDGEHAKWHSHRRYGGIWTIIPLSKIDNISIAEDTKRLLTVKYGLINGETLSRKYRIDNQAKIVQFTQEITSLRN